MPANCYSCKTPLILPSGVVSMSASCERCNADVRVCRNCKFYDLKSYNECREPQAERVVDKERRNRCDFFVLAPSVGLGQPGESSADPKEIARKKLDDLFK